VSRQISNEMSYSFRIVRYPPQDQQRSSPRGSCRCPGAATQQPLAGLVVRWLKGSPFCFRLSHVFPLRGFAPRRVSRTLIEPSSHLCPNLRLCIAPTHLPSLASQLVAGKWERKLVGQEHAQHHAAGCNKFGGPSTYQVAQQQHEQDTEGHR